jgi:hypothetical protein
MGNYHIAQVNIGRVKAPLDDPRMSGFVERLAEINALADSSAGFVWRLQTDAGDAIYLRPYDDDRILVNMSVWESVEALRQYVYQSAHVEVLRARQQWFEAFAGAYAAVWWVPAGHRPGIDEARKRLAHLEKHGPTQFAFTFKTVFPPDEEFQRSIDWTSFVPCPAV